MCAVHAGCAPGVLSGQREAANKIKTAAAAAPTNDKQPKITFKSARDWLVKFLLRSPWMRRELRELCISRAAHVQIFAKQFFP